MSSELVPLPHLKPNELAERDDEESVLGRKLTSCWHGDDFDAERAYQIMRGAAELIFDVTYKAYRGRSSYKDDWLPAIVKDAVYRTLIVSLPRIEHGVPDTRLKELAEILESTVADHLQEIAAPHNLDADEPNPDDWFKDAQSFVPTEQQAAEYAKIGVDLSTGSPPLLKAVAAAMQAKKVPAPRPATKKRVPRSISSMLAAEKMDQYRETIGLDQTQFAGKLQVDPKTLYKFRRTGKVDKRIAATIAKEMGISVEELLR